MSDEPVSVAQARQNAVDAKWAKLRGYFPPDVIGWYTSGSTGETKPKEGDAITLSPFVASYAVMDRLDEALGPDCWSATFHDVAGCVRCTLGVCFERGCEWVARTGVSAGPDGTKRKLEQAHAEALRDAAYWLGVGRYLRSEVCVRIADANGNYSRAMLSEYVLPEGYRKCGRDLARRIYGMADAACKPNAEFNRPAANLKAALASLARQHGGYGIAADGLPDIPSFQNRHANEIISRLSAWVADLAKDARNTEASPFYVAPGEETKPAPEKKKEEKSPPKP